jgi:outer membrane biosynthesis protein TonB
MVLASPIEPLAKPAYPKAALGREKLPVQVGVHITVDTTGRVAGVRMSLAAMTTPTPYMDEFRNAVEEALAQWRFRPAELRRLKPVTDTTGAPTWALDHREKTDCGFDVSFTFQSTGEVVSRGLR